jgi:hypothetical protein
MPLPKDKTTKELGFKVGDRFRVVIGGDESDSGSEFKVGDIITLTNDEGDDMPEFKDGSGHEAYEYLCNLEPFAKTLEYLSEADVVRDNVGDERTVMFVLKPGLYVLSQWNSPHLVGLISSARDLEDRGMTIKQDEPVVEEMTVAQIAKELGREIKVVKG